MEHSIFSGMGVALVTPFDETGAVDYPSLRRLIEHLRPGEATDFVVVHGTTGESPCLTRAERDRVTEVVIETVAGRCPIMIGLGGNNTIELGERIQALRPEGIDGILSVVPYYNKPSQDGIYQHFAYLADRSQLPIVVYNIPGRSGVNMMPETVLRLAKDFSNIVGIKEASGFVSQGEQIAQGVDRPDFVVLSGDDSLSVPFIRNGARGVISVVGNAYPQLFSQLIHCAMEGRYNEAEALQTQLRDLNTSLFANGNPSGIKALLYQMGLIEENSLRLPLVPVLPDTYKALEEARAKLDHFIAEEWGLLSSQY